MSQPGEYISNMNVHTHMSFRLKLGTPSSKLTDANIVYFDIARKLWKSNRHKKGSQEITPSYYKSNKRE